jgi:hypothetical protein
MIGLFRSNLFEILLKLNDNHHSPHFEAALKIPVGAGQ